MRYDIAVEQEFVLLYNMLNEAFYDKTAVVLIL
jgi:hypothetical protein